jgi:hypothetical protein
VPSSFSKRRFKNGSTATVTTPAMNIALKKSFQVSPGQQAHPKCAAIEHQSIPVIPPRINNPPIARPIYSFHLPEPISRASRFFRRIVLPFLSFDFQTTTVGAPAQSWSSFAGKDT